MKKQAFRVPAQTSIEILLAELSPAGRRKYLDVLLVEHFWMFLGKVFETVAPGKEFRRTWLIDAMTYAVEDVMDGTINRLITTVPPRHLKSIVFSYQLQNGLNRCSRRLPDTEEPECPASARLR